MQAAIQNIMKKNIHPQYFPKAQVRCVHAPEQSSVRDSAYLN
jgi:ribosomal protein L31